MTETAEFRLTVLNPGGRDPEQNFRDPSGPGTPVHPPVNFHAFAACTQGIFQHDTQRAVVDELPVLLLLRGDFRASERAFKELKRNGRKVAVSLKETGLHQIAEQLSKRARLARFMRMVEHADGCIATTPEAAEVYWRARLRRDPTTVAFIPTPYPLEDKQWDLSVPPNAQAGIFIGTREWAVPSRNHFAALLVARQLCEASGEPVTVFNLDGWKGRRRLAELKFPAGKLNVIEKEKPYADYLREIARHKIVLQLDRSRVPGQVAGDALLARTICVGGDGAIDRIVFSKTCGEGRSMNDLAKVAAGLLTNTNGRATLILESQWRAMERLSFQATRAQLANFFGRI
ncbi:MAG: hypothetical protein ABI925_09875 [Verrucomicrobiota bacterium]